MMNRSHCRIIFCFLVGLYGFSPVFAQPRHTKNLVVVTLDGFRWQELFRGADTALINSAFTADKSGIRKSFLGETAEDRRKKLLPFFWSTLASQGQLYGNRDLGNEDQVANPYFFSYPGYNEIFTGFPDVRMNTNDPITNPSMNVLEYINRQPGFEGKVGVFSSWERFPAILNQARSGLFINSGYVDYTGPDPSDRLRYLSRIQHEVPKLLGDSTRLDFLTFEMAREYMNQHKPRALYISFDETDDFAHEGHYDWYLRSAHQQDAFLNELWNSIQSNPYYKDQTTLLITCDHGRGEGNSTGKHWTDHGKGTPQSNQTWFAVIGPDSKALGEVRTHTRTFHKQLAQTMASLLSMDFKSAAGHEVGEPVQTVLAR